MYRIALEESTSGKRRQIFQKDSNRRKDGGEDSVARVGEKEKRNGRLDDAAETSAELAEWCRLPRKDLNVLGLPKRKAWLQCQKVSSWQGHQSRFCQKKKEQSRLSRVPDREVGESQGEREPHLGERQSESDREHGE